MQVAYKLQSSVRKRVLRNPYTVTKVTDVCEWVLLDVQSLGKHNDMHRYILSVIDDFLLKYLHLVSVKIQSGPSVASTFWSIFHDDESRLRRRLWVRTNKGKEFPYKQFQFILLNDGIQF